VCGGLLPIDYQRVRTELQTLTTKDFIPNITDACMYHLYKLRKLGLGCTDFNGFFRLLQTGNLHLLQQLLRIAPQKQSKYQHNDAPNTTQCQLPPRRHPAPVLEITAFSTAFPTHNGLTYWLSKKALRRRKA